MSTDEKIYLSAEEVAGQYGRTAFFWRVRAQRGLVQAYLIGDRYGFRPEDVEKFIRKSPVTGPLWFRDPRRAE